MTTKTNYSITIKGQSEFTEEQLYYMLKNNVVDGIMCVRSAEDSVLIKSDNVSIELEEVK